MGNTSSVMIKKNYISLRKLITKSLKENMIYNQRSVFGLTLSETLFNFDINMCYSKKLPCRK